MYKGTEVRQSRSRGAGTLGQGAGEVTGCASDHRPNSRPQATHLPGRPCPRRQHNEAVWVQILALPILIQAFVQLSVSSSVKRGYNAYPSGLVRGCRVHTYETVLHIGHSPGNGVSFLFLAFGWYADTSERRSGGCSLVIYTISVNEIIRKEGH